MLAGSAGTYETVLRPLEPFDLGIFERCPIGLPVAIAGDEAITQFLERCIGDIVRTRMTRDRHGLSSGEGRAVPSVNRSAPAALG
jgi:hypothetical protein